MTLQLLGAFLLQYDRGQDEGRAKLDEAIALWHAMGLSDQEEQARETARELGYEPG